MKIQKTLLLGCGLALSSGAFLALAQQTSTSPLPTSETISSRQATPTATPVSVLLTIDAYGNIYRPSSVVSEITSGDKTWQFVIREVPAPIKSQQSDRLVVFEVQNPSDSPGKSNVTWRYCASYPTFIHPYPRYDGDVVQAPDGNLLLLIANSIGTATRLQIFRIAPSSGIPNSLPSYDAQGQLMTVGKQARKPLTSFDIPEQSSQIRSVKIEKISSDSLVVRVHKDKDNQPWFASYFQGPVRYHYDFRSQKWSQSKPTPVELLQLKKDQRQKTAMDEYRRQRQRMGASQAQATDSVRFLLGDKTWVPVPEPWDTPDFMAKPYWLTPMPTLAPTLKTP